ncbi:MAG: undecaprenyl-diphosphate phosphatase [Spirochaetales bacterium]
MQDFFTAAILGVIEGFTEFLPVSSTGHLIIANQFLNFANPQFTKMFDIVIQLGAILAVALVFWKRLVPWGKHVEAVGGARKVWTLWLYAVIAFVPTGLAAFVLKDYMDQYLMTPAVVASTLVFYGIVFLFIERFAPKARVTDVTELGWKLALAIGFIQILSLVPGTSRSGITIIGALLLGVGRVAATEFTFFLALPTMGVATLYSLYKYVKETPLGFTGTELGSLVVGFVVSFFVAWAVIVGFVRFVQKNTFVAFGVYRIVLGAAVAVLLVLGVFHSSL